MKNLTDFINEAKSSFDLDDLWFELDAEFNHDVDREEIGESGSRGKNKTVFDLNDGKHTEKAAKCIKKYLKETNTKFTVSGNVFEIEA